MELTTYYGMDRNPFKKDIKPEELYTSNDYLQLKNRMEFLINTRGIGLFLSNPGMGKTASLRSVLTSLNQNRFKVIYICMTTVTPIDFYRMIADELGLEDMTKKSILFKEIQEELKRLVVESKMEIVIAVDEAQFLRKEVIREFVMLMNFDIDSKDFCTLILLGQNELIRTLHFKSMDAFRQRINMMYMFTGLNEKEVKHYVESRLEIVHCNRKIFEDEAYHTLYTLINGSIRVLNLLINKVLIIGMNQQIEIIRSEDIMKANQEITIG